MEVGVWALWVSKKAWVEAEEGMIVYMSWNERTDRVPWLRHLGLVWGLMRGSLSAIRACLTGCYSLAVGIANRIPSLETPYIRYSLRFKLTLLNSIPKEMLYKMRKDAMSKSCPYIHYPFQFPIYAKDIINLPGSHQPPAKLTTYHKGITNGV